MINEWMVDALAAKIEAADLEMAPEDEVRLAEAVAGIELDPWFRGAVVEMVFRMEAFGPAPIRVARVLIQILNDARDIGAGVWTFEEEEV